MKTGKDDAMENLFVIGIFAVPALLIIAFAYLARTIRKKMETGEISKKLKRGKHTTRHAELFRVAEDTYLCDTPGFTDLSLGDMPEEDIRHFYPEFVPYEGQCRFRECSHTHEPGCAVREAVEAGAIHPERHRAYVALYEEQKNRKKY